MTTLVNPEKPLRCKGFRLSSVCVVSGRFSLSCGLHADSISHVSTPTDAVFASGPSRASSVVFSRTAGSPSPKAPLAPLYSNLTGLEFPFECDCIATQNAGSVRSDALQECLDRECYVRPHIKPESAHRHRGGVALTRRLSACPMLQLENSVGGRSGCATSTRRTQW